MYSTAGSRRRTASQSGRPSSAACGNSLDEAEQRHYRVIEALYLRDRPLSPAAVAEMESIDKRTVYKDVDAACATLSALIFGIDGIKKA